MRRIVIFAFEQANLLDISGPMQVFATASANAVEMGLADQAIYETIVVSMSGGLARTTCGLEVNTAPVAELAGSEIDTLLVSGGSCSGVAADPEVLRWLNQQRTKVRRLGSVCTGAYVLAAAGILNAKRATTHWDFSSQLSRAFPTVIVESDALFIEDSGIWTSAGVTAGIDMALAMVERDFGGALALETARQLVLYLKRSGGQSPFSSYLRTQGITDTALRRLATWIIENPRGDLTTLSLARRAHVGLRSLFRAFRDELGTTPREFVERARLESARRLLEQTDDQIDQVAFASGFSTAEVMRRAFKRHFGVPPATYRERFSGTGPTSRPDAVEDPFVRARA